MIAITEKTLVTFLLSAVLTAPVLADQSKTAVWFEVMDSVYDLEGAKAIDVWSTCRITGGIRNIGQGSGLHFCTYGTSLEIYRVAPDSGGNETRPPPESQKFEFNGEPYFDCEREDAPIVEVIRASHTAAEAEVRPRFACERRPDLDLDS